MNDRRDTPEEAAVVVTPDASSVADAAKSRWRSDGSGPRSRRFRAQLNLPTDALVVMTGHQTNWWHAGILAKFIAAAELARCLDGTAAWIVPDQDEQTFQSIDTPVRASGGALERRALRVAPDPPVTAPTASLPAFEPAQESDSINPALPEIAQSLDRLRESLARHRGEASAARQIASALRELMSPAVPPSPTVFASELRRSDLFNEIVDAMRDDPMGATRAYNAAVADHPEARVAPLMHMPSQSRFELPLWRLGLGRPRRTVYSNELDDIPREELAPKALLMTGLLRLAAADLFIHGTGGGAYDAITERWLQSWLGWTLAPMLIVSATVRLPLANEAPSPREVRRAVWRAHHARHHPAELGLDRLQRTRDELAAATNAAREAGNDPAPNFRRLQDLLDEYRREHADALNKLERDAETMRSRRSETEIAQARTWPFFFHSDAALKKLSDRIRERVCLTRSSAPTPA